jgi:purine-cytosine permease-like protein
MDAAERPIRRRSVQIMVIALLAAMGANALDVHRTIASVAGLLLIIWGVILLRHPRHR